MKALSYKNLSKMCMWGIAVLAMAWFMPSHASAQQGRSTTKGLYEVFSTQMPDGTTWKADRKYVRDGGYSKKTPHYIYVRSNNSPANMTGLSIPIRENPGPGQYRYLTFAWVKWGNGQIGIKFDVNDKSASQKGRKYDFTYLAGESEDIINQLNGLNLGKKPGQWTVMTRDLWKDFGNITITGISFLCQDQRDAGFDEIFLAKSEDDIKNAPKVLPSEIATPQPVYEAGDTLTYEMDAEEEQGAQPVQIDWAAQIRAGGSIMYPLYFLGLLALVISIQRFVASRSSRLAPKALCNSVNECLSQGDISGALQACKRYPSTLANSLEFIFTHVKAGREAVSQTAGDMAARDIRTHLSRIYPLSIIASLAPLLGLLGTVVGMIEAFGLVALYGDEGGASILSDSISKALITTAAGLIIAAPAIALYFIIKNRVMNMASRVEVEIENVITELYLDKNPEGEQSETDNKE